VARTRASDVASTARLGQGLRVHPNPTLSCARQVALRPGDVTWADFLASGEGNAPSFEPHVADPDELTNVLFSSGTTGVPQCSTVPNLQ